MKKKVKDSIGYLTARASYALATQVYRDFYKRGIDLPHSQFVVLRHLFENDGQTQQELANTLFKDKAAIKRTVDNLVIRGYVSRIKEGKTYRISLTARALEIKNDILKIADNTVKSALAGVSSSDHEICLKVLKKITENILMHD